jgi:hypothetical protein
MSSKLYNFSKTGCEKPRRCPGFDGATVSFHCIKLVSTNWLMMAKLSHKLEMNQSLEIILLFGGIFYDKVNLD